MNRIIPTCETAVSAIPEWHRAAFKDCPERVISTEGWSPGAFNLAQGVAGKVHAQLLHNSINRLLIDLACSPHDPARWSDLAMTLTDEQRRKLDEREMATFLQAIETQIHGALRQQQQPVHLSFDTRPDLGGEWLVIEHDTSRAAEGGLVEELLSALRQRLPQACLRTADAPPDNLSSWLRGRHPQLVSLRLTAAQSIFLEGRPTAWTPFKQAVVEAVASLR